jgi:hypothetical protein
MIQETLQQDDDTKELQQADTRETGSKIRQEKNTRKIAARAKSASKQWIAGFILKHLGKDLFS